MSTKRPIPFPFLPVPPATWAPTGHELALTERLVLGVLAQRYRNGDDRIRIGVPVLMATTGLPNRTVQLAIKALLRYGLIGRAEAEGGRGRVPLYWLTDRVHTVRPLRAALASETVHDSHPSDFEKGAGKGAGNGLKGRRGRTRLREENARAREGRVAHASSTMPGASLDATRPADSQVEEDDFDRIPDVDSGEGLPPPFADPSTSSAPASDVAPTASVSGCTCPNPKCGSSAVVAEPDPNKRVWICRRCDARWPRDGTNGANTLPDHMALMFVNKGAA